ncbi:MAG: SHOCT domain-containing protein [Firmicutes bacterium]|nr:SHOCT domain-containing protein [Bacillota bacterium]
MMHGFGGIGLLSGIFSMLLPLLIIFGLISLISRLSKGNGGRSFNSYEDDPMAIIKKRYARGEIDQDEYIKRMVDLEGYNNK